ncbi:MAG: hypothetical protein JW819_06130 [Candidatus Krumholzibacteriota bacterium]|nr:hypothetical protein [Candidatus Krumholzibacteriota bacterium]
MGKTAVRVLFVIAAVYDGVLGLVFLVAPAAMFRWFGVTPPNHYGYVQFPALLLIVFGLLFAAVARNPVRNRNLIPYGVMLKIAYCGTVFAYWLSQGIPGMWKPFAIADLAFLVLFLWAYRSPRAYAAA